MSDISKIQGGFSNNEIVKADNNIKEVPVGQNSSGCEESEVLQHVTSQHFVPGQAQIPNDNFASDLDLMQKHPTLVNTANEIYDKVFDDCISLGDEEVDAAGKAANVQATFVQEVLGY